MGADRVSFDDYFGRAELPRGSPRLSLVEYKRYCELAHENKYNRQNNWMDIKSELMALEQVLQERSTGRSNNGGGLATWNKLNTSAGKP